MIKFDRVSKHYPGGGRALADVSFDIKRGSMVFLTGHSGAGKSTLLRLVMMLERSSRGQVIVNDRNLEVVIAMEEQGKITQIRLKKLIS